MKALQIKWVRILISLFGGALIAELIHVPAADPNRPNSENSSIVLFLFAIIIYVVLTYLLKIYGKIK